MYSGKTAREQNPDFVLPVAIRQIMFSDEECLEEGYFGFDPITMKDEYRKNLELIYFSDAGKSVFQITDAYPIVQYCAENADRLNRFVESITVAVVSGKKIKFDKNFLPTEEIIDDEVVAYITNPFGVSTAIYYNDLIKLLYKKPKLTVTNEGVLLFYTPTRLFITLDCTSGNYVMVKELAEVIGKNEIEKISSITVDEDGRTVIRFDTKDNTQFKKQITILFDFFGESGVSIEI